MSGCVVGRCEGMAISSQSIRRLLRVCTFGVWLYWTQFYLKTNHRNICLETSQMPGGKA